MRIITKKRLEEFSQLYPDSRVSLKYWFDEIKSNNFYSPVDIIQVFNSADYVGNDRIIFNFSKNKFRLIANFNFHEKAQLVFIRFIGTHKDYDKIKDIKNI